MRLKSILRTGLAGCLMGHDGMRLVRFVSNVMEVVESCCDIFCGQVVPSMATVFKTSMG